MSYNILSRILKDELNLDIAPIALKRVDSRPREIPDLERRIPSTCAMWREAEKGVFYASAEAHMQCAVGAMVMGFPLSKDQEQDLMGTVTTMCEVGYLKEEEVPLIPKFENAMAGIVYGPLSLFPLEPEVVILWLNAKQIMQLQEITENTSWINAAQANNLGRPGCAVVPFSFRKNQSTLSNGCTGMRTFTEIPDTQSLYSIPGSILPELEKKLTTVLRANKKMESLYLEKKEAFLRGGPLR